MPAGRDLHAFVRSEQRRLKRLAQEQDAELGLTNEQKQEVLDGLKKVGFPDALADRLVQLAEGTRLRHGFCPRCRNNVDVMTPDSAGQLKAIEMAMHYMRGKPTERRQVDITVSNKTVNEMDHAERDAYKQRLLEQVQRQLPPSV